MRSRSKALAAIAVAAVLMIPTTLSGTALGASGFSTDKTIPSKKAVQDAQARARAGRAQVAALQGQVAASSAKLVTLGANLAQASELYNAALFQEQQAKQKADAANASATAAQLELVQTQTALSQFASAAYRSGGDIVRLSTMLGANGPQDLFDQASTMNLLSARQASALRRVSAARATAQVLQTQATQALTEQQTATAQVQASRDKAQTLLDEQQSQATALATQQRQLTVQVAALTSKSDRLAAQRAAGLAAAAAAAAAGQSGAGDGGDLGIPRGILLGMPANVPAGSQQGNAVGARKAIAYARAQIGKPYVWAAAGPDTFDCSGLTMMSWRAGGVGLPHWSVAQYAQGKKIPLGQLRPGDLVFFATDLTEYRSIHQVGLYIGGGQMIEAPYTGANVRISTIARGSLYGAVRP